MALSLSFLVLLLTVVTYTLYGDSRICCLSATTWLLSVSTAAHSLTTLLLPQRNDQHRAARGIITPPSPHTTHHCHCTGHTEPMVLSSAVRRLGVSSCDSPPVTTRASGGGSGGPSPASRWRLFTVQDWPQSGLWRRHRVRRAGLNGAEATPGRSRSSPDGWRCFRRWGQGR